MSDQTETDKKAQIRQLLDEAMKLYGPSIELAAIEGSWGDTMSDDETLEALTLFLKTGTIFDDVTVQHEDREELEKAYRDGLTKH